jgi:hypothetical protein
VITKTLLDQCDAWPIGPNPAKCLGDRKREKPGFAYCRQEIIGRLVLSIASAHLSWGKVSLGKLVDGGENTVIVLSQQRINGPQLLVKMPIGDGSLWLLGKLGNPLLSITLRFVLAGNGQPKPGGPLPMMLTKLMRICAVNSLIFL